MKIANNEHKNGKLSLLRHSKAAIKCEIAQNEVK